MFDKMKQFILPDQVLTEIRDTVVDKLAGHLEGKKRNLVLKFHSDSKFREDFNAALERAYFQFIQEYEDRSIIDAITKDTNFWDLKNVQDAVKKIAVRPSSYLEDEFAMLYQSFSEIMPTVASERVRPAVVAFLRCVANEVMNIPQLAPIYQVQLHT